MVVTEGTTIVLSNSQSSADMIRAVMEPSIIQSGLGIVMVVGMLFLMAFIFSGFFKAIGYVRESKQYRQKITDMYVVGVIKNFAQADKVDVEEELKLYNKDTLQSKKDKKRESQELDDTIEANLKEEVDAHTEKKLQEIKNGL